MRAIRGGLTAVFIGCLAFLVAACDPAGTGLGGSLGRPAAEGSLRVTALIGPPEAVQSRVLGAIANKSAAEGLPIAIGTDSPAEHSITGYLTATTVGSRTQMAYVWDIFDRSNERVHRVSGELTVNRSASNPWDAVDAETDRRIADEAVSGIKTWADARPNAGPRPSAAVQTPQPNPSATAAAVSTATETQSVPNPTPAPQSTDAATGTPSGSSAGQALAFAGSAATPDDATARPRTTSVPAGTGLLSRLARASQPGPATADTPSYRRTSTVRGVPVVLSAVNGAPEGTAEAFAGAITRAMSPYQVAVRRTAPEGKAHRLTADISVSPPERGRQITAIIWTVEDDKGRRLGTVRQVNKVPKNPGADGWERYADQAAERAAYGLAELIDENPV